MSEKAMTFSAPRPPLRLVRGTPDYAPDWSWFCGRCAAIPYIESVSPAARVCPSCGQGLLLEVRSDAVPFRDDAFLVVDSRLTVQTLSLRAQALLGKSAEDVIGRPVARFLGAADAEANDSGPDRLIDLLRDASIDSDEPRSVCVRPHGAFGVRVNARIVPCGPPRGALIVLSNQAVRLDMRLLRSRTPVHA
jgi:PAS domain-containing protein